MKYTQVLLCATLCTFFSPLAQASLFINEFHYDNSGMDVNEGIELAGLAGTDLSGYHILLYNGSNGTVYSDIELEGILPEESFGYGALFFASSLQNGPDGIALTNSDGDVLQFVSYEGSFMATSGDAAGMTSVDIGLFEASNSKPNASLQLAGFGPDSFEWIIDTASSGQLNAQQSFGAQVPLPATLPLLVSSFAAFGLFRRERKNQG